MDTLLETYFDIEGTRYDIFKIHCSCNCSVTRDSVILFSGSLADCRKFTLSLIVAFNQLYID